MQRPHAARSAPDFPSSVFSAFAFPFRGTGWLLVILGGVVIWLSNLVPGFGAFVISIVVGGYLVAFMLKVTASVAEGDEETPDWPDMTDFFSSILRPFFMMFLIVLTSFFPMIMSMMFFSPLVPVHILLGLFGLIYMPMGFLAVAMFKSIEAVNPAIVLGSIMRVPLDYLICLFVLAMATGVYVLLSLFLGTIPWIGGLIASTVYMYFIVVECSILGLLYYHNSEKLNWEV